MFNAFFKIKNKNSFDFFHLFFIELGVFHYWIIWVLLSYFNQSFGDFFSYWYWRSEFFLFCKKWFFTPILTFIPIVVAEFIVIFYICQSLYFRKKPIVMTSHIILHVIWYTSSIYDILYLLPKFFSSLCQYHL